MPRDRLPEGSRSFPAARPLALLAVTLALLAVDVRAQRADAYPTLVRMYAAGQGAEAIAALLRYPHGAIIDTAKRESTTLAPRELIAAAALHTEAAIAIVDARPFAAAAHVEVSKHQLETAVRSPGTSERASAVARRWYSVVVNLFTSANQLQLASSYVTEGLLAFPRDASMYYLRGTIAERGMQLRSDRDLRRGPDNSRERTRAEGFFKRAVEDYQRALHIDAHLATAHLHIGWTRLYLGDARAGPELEAAAADARTDRVRYLAHVFLGGLAEHDKRLEDARREYATALEIGPRFQTAYLALSRAEEALGHSRRAQELATACAQLQKNEPDPWWDFVSSFDHDALADLRTEVRRP